MKFPVNNLEISKSITFNPGSYNIPDGIKVTGNGIMVDGNGAVLYSDNPHSVGVRIVGGNNITIKNINLVGYYHGVKAENTKHLTISECRITHTHEVPANTIFLDIWIPYELTYGAGILLSNVQEILIDNNDLSHQMNGLLTYQCNRMVVKNNLANYCSGWGFHLNNTSNSTFEHNFADFCCRYEPRGPNRGHMGADSAGFLLVNQSCNNIFRNNFARLGGDGFFLAGLTPNNEPAFCNNNLFEGNDGSYSPNNAFEATFSAGNIFRSNIANHSNYGYWLGFSRDGLLENNQISGNRQAGIATENGINFTIRANRITNNNHGILLWSKHVLEFDKCLPENITSASWIIEDNILSKNKIAIRIAADQDHGIRPLPSSGDLGYPGPKPTDHVVRNNKFFGNLLDIEEDNTINTIFEENEILNDDKGS